MCFLDVSAHIQSFLTVSNRFQSISLSSVLSSENVFFRRFSPYSVISENVFFRRFQPILSHLWSLLTIFSRFHEVHLCPLRMCFLDVSAHIQPSLVVSDRF